MVHLAGYSATPSHPRVLRAAMGSELLVRWRAWPDARHCIEWLRAQGFAVVGLEPASYAHDYRTYDYRLPLCVVIGNEALGISGAVARRLDAMVRIPMHGYKGSLNVVVALGILLFHVVGRLPEELPPPLPPPRLDEGSLVARLWEAGARAVWSGPRVQDASLALCALAPHLPRFDAWVAPERGGVVLLTRDHLAGRSSPRWRLRCGEGPCPEEAPPDAPPPTHPRSAAFEAAVGIARALSSEGRARIFFDHVVANLLLRHGLESHEAEPALTRFLDASSFQAMAREASRLVDELLRPLDGAWKPDEVLYDPPEVGEDERVEAFVRRVFGPELGGAPTGPS